MRYTDMDEISKKSRLRVSFAIEPVDHSRPEEIKSVEVNFLGHIIMSLREAFRKARSEFSTDDPRSVILLSDHAHCVIKEQVTLKQLLSCCVTIDIDGLSHYLTITEYNWTNFILKEDELLRTQFMESMAV
ncbi:hypothetical protein [Acinetobacter sp. YH12153]|uniref:hypothetical protein n=1 Tax=Acinetobacter sp. YH12153 TaxID=2601133 RepID=UPI0015D46963|nr:hypothetical protein [Acinetobacter sp. YH12153]